MMLPLSRRVLFPVLAGVLLLAGSTLPVAAQPEPPQGPPETIEQMAQNRLAMLKDELRITPAQEGAWNRFAELSLQNAAQMDQMFRHRGDQVSNMNAVENLQTFAQIQMRQARDFERLVPAFRQLYGELSPQQQQAADEAFRSMGPHPGNGPASRG